MPTLLDLAGHPVPDHVQGRSLAPFLLGDRDPADSPMYTFSERIPPNPEHTRTVRADAQGAFMIRGGGWKYFRYPSGEEYLYHLADDPGETRNLAGDPSCQDRKAEVRGELQRWLDETGHLGAQVDRPDLSAR
jgi:arylsulfatase A-like enzyme